MPGASFLKLAAVISAHDGGAVCGRTRLQKTIKLLQSKGLRTGYMFSIYHYGPYCDEILEDVNILQDYGLVTESEQVSQEGGRKFFKIQLKRHDIDLPEISEFRSCIDVLKGFDSVILELAATFMEFRERDNSRDQALELLQEKKHSKCSEDNLKKMWELLMSLELG